MNPSIRGAGFAAAALVLLYVGFGLGQYFAENPDQRRAVRVLTAIVTVVIAALVFAFGR